MRVFLVKSGLERFEFLAGAAEKDIGDVAADGKRHDARARQAAVERKRRQFARVRRVGSRDKEDGLGAALPGQHGLISEAGIAVELLAAFRRDIFWHVAQEE